MALVPPASTKPLDQKNVWTPSAYQDIDVLEFFAGRAYTTDACRERGLVCAPFEFEMDDGRRGVHDLCSPRGFCHAVQLVRRYCNSKVTSLEIEYTSDMSAGRGLSSNRNQSPARRCIQRETDFNFALPLIDRLKRNGFQSLSFILEGASQNPSAGATPAFSPTPPCL